MGSVESMGAGRAAARQARSERCCGAAGRTCAKEGSTAFATSRLVGASGLDDVLFELVLSIVGAHHSPADRHRRCAHREWCCTARADRAATAAIALIFVICVIFVDLVIDVRGFARFVCLDRFFFVSCIRHVNQQRVPPAATAPR